MHHNLINAFALGIITAKKCDNELHRMGMKLTTLNGCAYASNLETDRLEAFSHIF